MCGICGFTNFKDDALLHKMAGLLEHRGPDGEGFYTSQENEVSLAMRRLAIIDLNTGGQPIFNEDKTVVVVFNGEIYNFKGLRDELRLKGHVFKTQTDTEVIVHAYEEYGEACVKHFAGMFAIALWDVKNKKLFIARDRLGIKPLFYSVKNGKLYFSSEINSLSAGPEISKGINLRSFDKYLTFLYCPAPETFYEDIKQLPAGCTMVFQNKQVSINKYWKIDFEKAEHKTEKHYIDQIDELLNTIIKEHLISDVPTGIFLSGGRDSSTITAIAAKNSNIPINTFSLGFLPPDDSFNELDKSKAIAQYLKTNHTQTIINSESGLLLDTVTKHFGQPFADSSALVTYLISKISREKLTVALTGIGGDELFCGYPRYQGMKLAQYLPKINIPVELINSIAESYASNNPAGRVKRFLYGMRCNERDRYLSYTSYFKQEEKNELYTDKFVDYLGSEDSFAVHKKYYDSCYSNDLVDKIMRLDIKTYLVDDLLFMADTMSMANSLELRVPMCDHRLVEYMAKIPAKLRMKGFTQKYLLKKLMQRYIPETIINQKKQGFMAPLARWLTDALRTQVESFVNKKEFKNYLNYAYIEKIWNDHKNGRKNYSDQLWSFLVFEKWRDSHNIKMPDLSVKIKPVKKISNPYDFKKILLINVAGIGDFIESIGAIKSIREACPDSVISLLVSSKVFNYAKDCPYVDKVYELPVKHSRGFSVENWNEIIRFLKSLGRLRKNRFDLAVNFSEISSWFGALRMALLLKYAGITQSLGRNTQNRGLFFTRRINDFREYKYNQFHYFNRITELLSTNFKQEKPRLWQSSEDVKKVDGLLKDWNIKLDKPIILINPGSDRLTRRWETEGFAKAADYFAKKYSANIIFLGSLTEKEIAEAIIKKMNTQAILTAGLLNIDQLINLVSRANLLLTTNSAAMHIAGIEEIPFVAVAGSGDPWRDTPSGDEEKMKLLWKKMKCNPCYYWKCPKKAYMHCMKIITPEEVIQEAEKFMVNMGY